jgi:hypothetical protein
MCASGWGMAMFLSIVGAGCASMPPSAPQSSYDPATAPRPAPTNSPGTDAPPTPAPSTASSAQTPPPGVVIYDPSSNAQGPNVKMLVGPDKLSTAAAKRILDRIFSGGYLTDNKQCRGVADNLRGAGARPEAVLPAARAQGDFVPFVFEVAAGSFTAPRVSQTLYLITVGECGAIHAENWGSNLLAVFQGDAVVAQSIIAGGSSIGGVFDLDGDGQSEFLLAGGYTGMGETIVVAQLSRFDHAKLVNVKSFGQVLNDSCGSIDPNRGSKFSVIRALAQPVKPLEFHVEQVTKPCQ